MTKTSLTIFLTILSLAISNCATSKVACPVDVPSNWRRPPLGQYNYSPVNQPVLFECDRANICKIHLDNYKILLKNFAKCERTREDMVTFFDHVSENANFDYLKEELGDSFVGETVDGDDL